MTKCLGESAVLVLVTSKAISKECARLLREGQLPRCIVISNNNAEEFMMPHRQLFLGY